MSALAQRASVQTLAGLAKQRRRHPELRMFCAVMTATVAEGRDNRE
jgi:hypothetical protein